MGLKTRWERESGELYPEIRSWCGPSCQAIVIVARTTKTCTRGLCDKFEVETMPVAVASERMTCTVPHSTKTKSAFHFFNLSAIASYQKYCTCAHHRERIGPKRGNEHLLIGRDDDV